MKTGVYSITCLPSGKRYIGSALRIRSRWACHRHALRNGRHVVIERRTDGLRQLALVRVGFNLSHILDGEWFAPKLPTMDGRP